MYLNKIKLKYILNIVLSGVLFFVILGNIVQADELLNGLDQAAIGAGMATDVNSPQLIIAGVIRTFLGFLGIIFFSLTVYGGFTWMLAGGNSEQVTKAKKIVINATIGLAIILMSYTITTMVIEAIVTASKG